jgi:hypothetical protein
MGAGRGLWPMEERFAQVKDEGGWTREAEGRRDEGRWTAKGEKMKSGS